MSENLIIFNARIVTPIGFSARKGEEMVKTVVKTGMVTTSTIGIITLADIAFYPVSSIPIPILYLVENVPKNSPGV